MRMLVLSRTAYDGIVDHALAGAPEEVCGVLGGDHGSEESRADRGRRAENAAAHPRTAYAIDPEEQLALMEGVEDAGREVVGFYHSHPAGPPEPSETDVARATWPGYSYVVVVLDGTHPYVGSWRWTGEEFRQEIVRVR